MSFWTYQDTIDHLVDYLGGAASDVVVRDCKRAAQEALRTLANAHNWSYLYTHGRVNTNGMFTSTTGTVQFQKTSGSYPNQLTISGDTWPSWAAAGCYIRIGVVNEKVAERKSATVLTLDPTLSPAGDLAAGTEFQALWQDSYLLPTDFVAQDQALYENNFAGMNYLHPREWLYTNRYVYNFGIPQSFTVTGDEDYPGRMLMRVFPFPSASVSLDFIYKRRPRDMSLASYATGTVSLSSGLATVTGSGTAFSPAMVGSVFRCSATTTAPTGWLGKSPPAFESVIASYTSATQITLSDVAPASYPGVAFTVSDPVDVELGTMQNVYLRCAEMHLSMNRTLKDKPSARLQYEDALFRARCADSRSFAGRAEGELTKYRQRLRDMPLGPDVSQ